MVDSANLTASKRGHMAGALLPCNPRRAVVRCVASREHTLNRRLLSCIRLSSKPSAPDPLLHVGHVGASSWAVITSARSLECGVLQGTMRAGRPAETGIKDN